MSMVPARDPAICPVCGDRREGGCHPCPGPRVQQSGEPRVLRDVELVAWGPDFITPDHPLWPQNAQEPDP